LIEILRGHFVMIVKVRGEKKAFKMISRETKASVDFD
jgi:hypothetical protein